MIRLRPHHLLCTQGYQGKGYSAAFVRNMNAVVARLRNEPETRIELTFGADSLCACCPHRVGENRCDAQDKVTRFDRKVIEYFGLREGEYSYRALVRAIAAQITPAVLADICADCAWYPVSACRAKICGE